MGAGSRLVALFAMLGCGGAIVGACSSSDTSSDIADSGGGIDATTPNEGAAPEGGKEAAVGPDGGDGGGVDGGEGGVADSGCPVGTSIATVDAGAQWGCLQSACMSELAACASDCVCNSALLGALVCVAGGQSATACFTNAIQQNLGDLYVVAVGSCLQTNAVACLAVGEGGTDAAADATPGEGGGRDGGQDGSLEAGTDAGSGDGSDGASSSDGSGGASDATSDAGTGDAPSGD